MGKLYGEIQEELSAFKDFKNNFKFRQLALEAKGLEIYCVDLLVKDKDDNTTAITDKWINVGYKLNNPFSRCLSNLFPYEFIFKGKKARSIEAVLQCLKFKDIDKQDIILTYS
ncbi:MAG: hypothetical protein LBT30_02010 [Clostridiales bacterium]|jgi:hypothetical protein|nr:hypothetical protein [Clostridiales bacterium]